MTVCCVFGCNNRSEQCQDKNISFHKFPSKQKSREQYNEWIKRINREDFVPSKYSHICSVHFNEEDYELSCKLKSNLLHTKLRRVLRSGAVPSLNLKENNVSVDPTTIRTASRDRKKKLMVCGKYL